MMKLSELFWTCHTISYDTVGDNVNYKFVEDDSTLYIYFQGSNQTKDWIRNFMFKDVPYKDMDIKYKVHKGFLVAWKEVEDIIINKIKETLPQADKSGPKAYRWKHIVVVGYSHGAALSGFCHECVWFHRDDLRNKGLEGYGFESPRFFSAYIIPEALRDRWSNYYIIKNYNDIVTHCPPWIFKYHHVGNLIKIKTKRKIGPIKAHFPEEVMASLVNYENQSSIINIKIK